MGESCASTGVVGSFSIPEGCVALRTYQKVDQLAILYIPHTLQMATLSSHMYISFLTVIVCFVYYLFPITDFSQLDFLRAFLLFLFERACKSVLRLQTLSTVL